MRIGVSANLDEGVSVHTGTFLEGVRLGLTLSGRESEVTPIYVSDHATSEGGRAAAMFLVAQGVKAIVGHYASAAAWEASALYREHQLPVFLPAATHPDLNRPEENIFQLCPSDRELCSHILAFLMKKRISTVHLECDRSFHGVTVMGVLRTMLPLAGIRNTSDQRGSDCMIYSGMYANSVKYVNSSKRVFPDKTIILTDDACHPEIVNAIDRCDGVYIFGLAPSHESEECREFTEQYRQLTRKAPPTYLLETVVAMEMAIQYAGLVPQRRLSETEIHTLQWNTRLGRRTLPEIKAILAAYVIWEVSSGSIVQSRRSINCKNTALE